MAAGAQTQTGGWKLPEWLGSGAISDYGTPLAVLGIVLALIVPLPAFVLDVLIAADIMMSVLVLMVALYIKRPVDFNVFPTMLLLLTLFRLALNISSSRLILLEGNTGTAAACRVMVSRIAKKSCQSRPPGSGVPTDGIIEGSNPSRSIVQ